MNATTEAQAAVDAAEARAQTTHLWPVAAAQAHQVNDPRADDWDWAAGSVAGIAELHALEIHLDQAAAELGGIA